MSKQADNRSIDRLVSRLQQMPQVEFVQVISDDEALEEFKNITGLYSIIEFVPDNPLPTTIVVRLQEEHANIKTFENLATDLRLSQVVDAVEYDLVWIQRLRSAVNFSRTMFTAISGFLLLSAILIVCYTTRISVDTRKDEIHLLEQIGGTRSYICRPFVYTAVIHSLLAVALGLGIAEGFRILVNQSIADLVLLYNSDFSLARAHALAILFFALSVALLSWIAAKITVFAHLRRKYF